MNAKQIIVGVVAVALGLASAYVVGAMVHRGFQGDMDTAGYVFLLLAVGAAGILVFLTRPREIRRSAASDPALILSRFFAFCAAICCCTLEPAIIQPVVGANLSWPILALAYLAVVVASASVYFLVIRFVHSSSLKFLRHAFTSRRMQNTLG